jgi:hypothetical protein
MRQLNMRIPQFNSNTITYENHDLDDKHTNGNFKIAIPNGSGNLKAPMENYNVNITNNTIVGNIALVADGNVQHPDEGTTAVLGGNNGRRRIANGLGYLDEILTTNAAGEFVLDTEAINLSIPTAHADIVQQYNDVVNNVVYGCTEEAAFNYDSLANTNNGSCIDVAYGCLDPNAFNYNANANTNDNSCIAVALGCIDSSATNYDPDANTNGGNCEYDSTDTSCFPEKFEGNTGNNMTLMLTNGVFHSLPVITVEDAYISAISDGMVVGSSPVYGVTQTAIAVWGDDTSTGNVDGALTGSLITFQLVDGSSLYTITLNALNDDAITYTANGTVYR